MILLVSSCLEAEGAPNEATGGGCFLSCVSFCTEFLRDSVWALGLGLPHLLHLVVGGK